MPQIFQQLARFGFGGVEVHTLIGSRQKSTAPVLHANNRQTTRAKDHKSREIAALGTQPIEQPRTDTGSWKSAITGIHQHKRWFMVWNLRLHRADNAHAIGMARCGFGEQFTYFKTRLAISAEFKRRTHHPRCFAFGTQGSIWHRLAMQSIELGLGIKGIHLTRSTIHEKVDQPLGTRLSLRRPRRERVGSGRAPIPKGSPANQSRREKGTPVMSMVVVP